MVPSKPRHLSGTLRLALLSILASTIASATPASLKLPRADTCSSKELHSCSSDLPRNFCCPKGAACLSLAGGTTAVCCPSGSTCNAIEPITCSVSAQDPNKDPNAPIKTSVFDVDLQTCGDKTCCPFGYSCSKNKLCIKNDDQSKKPKEIASISSLITISQPTPTSTDIDSPASTPISTTASTTASTTPTASPTQNADDDKPSPKSKTTSIIGGLVGGSLVLLLIAVIIFIYLRRSRRQNGNASPGGLRGNKNGGLAPTGNVISEPILQPNSSYRTDFILKPPSSGTSMTQVDRNSYLSSTTKRKSQRPRISIPNPFSSPNSPGHSPTHTRASYTSNDDRSLRTGHVVNARLAPIRAMKASSTYSRRPSTRGVERQPSGESIDVFADPTEVQSVRGYQNSRYTQATTFSDMMNEASLSDVHQGKSYVPGTTPRI